MDNCLSVNCDGEINAGVRSDDDDWRPLGGSETALFCSAFSPLLLTPPPTPPGFEPPPPPPPPPRSGLFDFDFAAHRTPRRVAACLLPLDGKATSPPPPVVVVVVVRGDDDFLRPPPFVVVVVVVALDASIIVVIFFS
jgi:hypothetical protein